MAKSHASTKYPNSGTGGGHVIQENSNPLTQRTNLNFVGATVVDDFENDTTKVTITLSGVPYSGATGNVDIGQYYLTAGHVTISPTTDIAPLTVNSYYITPTANFAEFKTSGFDKARIDINGGYTILGSGGFTASSGTGLFAKLQIPLIYPGTDGTAAIKITKNDQTTEIFTVDTTNSRIGINSTSAPLAALDIQSTASPQLIVRYNSTNYAKLSVSSSGKLTLGTGNTSNFIFAADPSIAGYSNIWAGGLATPDSTNYNWQNKNDGKEVWFNSLTGGYIFFTINNAAVGNILVKGTKVGIGMQYDATPSAKLHIAAGAAGAGTAPLKLTSGTVNTTAEAGAIEFTTDDFFATITTAATRKAFVLDDGARLTSGKIPIASTNGRLIDGQTPLAGTKVYYVSDTSGGTVDRKLTFISGILTAEV